MWGDKALSLEASPAIGRYYHRSNLKTRNLLFRSCMHFATNRDQEIFDCVMSSPETQYDMDVDPIMKKTTVRFVGVGATLLLSALALALAQHDARENSDTELILAKPISQPPELIPVDDSPLWGHSSTSSSTIVRANDGSTAQSPSLNYSSNDLTMPPSPLPVATGNENPLRTAGSPTADGDNEFFPGEVTEDSNIRLVAGEGPPKTGLPEIPSTMPTLGAQPIPASTAPPQLGGTSGGPGGTSGGDVIRAPKPSWTQAPPTLGSGTLSPPPAPISMPASPPPAVPASRPTTQSFSDQMPAMPPTNLAIPANKPQQPPAIGNGYPNSSSNSPAASLNNSSALPPSLSQPGMNSPGTAPQGQLIAAPAAKLGAPTAAGNSANSVGANGAMPDSSARSPYAGTLLGRLISNQPGNSALLGSQNPIMLIQKRMAGECQVGKKATVIITVRNAGNSTAQDVEVIDTVPSGASFAEAMPSVTPTAEGLMVWKLGEMGPNDEKTITLQIVPERQGEMGSTAIVRFAAQASMRTLATLPKLELTFQAAPDVLIGGAHSVDILVRNTGTGVARGVILEADLPKNLRHDTGEVGLEHDLGDIAPGESQRKRLDTRAIEPGAATIALRAKTEDGIQHEQFAELRVLAPALEAVITGPNRRYLDRQAKFQVTIKNTGTATATKCEFTMRLPAGLNFNGASNSGEYSSADHAVMWSVPEWPAGHSEEIELTVLPVEVGSQQMIFQGMADLGVKTEARGGLTVEEQGELTFTIDQDADPIELSASTTYTIEVRNIGRPDRNVELSLQLPPGSEVLKVDAPVQARVEGDTLRFDPLAQLDGRASQKFRVEVRHGKVGTQKVSAQLRSQNRPTLVIKEEATEVYNDRD